VGAVNHPRKEYARNSFAIVPRGATVHAPPTKEHMAKTKRAVDFTDDQIKQLDELGAALGTATGAETIRRAIPLALRVVQHDGRVLLEHASGDVETLVVS